ncbi:recombinase family protein [Intrasporangium flavum]|uniref:recombinase family protein n=1 Tax=Intrasporangium flavum TaxID=1428657 RepID=UPI00096CDF82|nr:recombinase family protein [Intrasporangium flavum]
MSNEAPIAGYLVGYARVSTLEQDAALQRDALQAAGCQRIFTDKASGKLEHRPALDAMLEQLRPGDTVVVWRLDRLGRSLRHLIHTVQILESRGVAFRSVTENIDTSTAGGKLVFHLFGALAEFERDLIRERTLAGLAAARARGRTGGRPTVWTPEKLKVARSMYDSREHDVASIARVVGVSRASVYRALAQFAPDELSP